MLNENNYDYRGPACVKIIFNTKTWICYLSSNEHRIKLEL